MMNAGRGAKRPDEREAVAVVGEPDVAQDDVGRLAFDELGGRGHIRRRPDDLDVGRPPDQGGEPIGEGRVVLDDREPDHDTRGSPGTAA